LYSSASSAPLREEIFKVIDMKTSEFFFELPEGLIAQYPPEKRGQSRLMLLDRRTGKRVHRMVEDLPEILCGPEFRGKDGEKPLLVFNNSKVRKARLVGSALHTGAQAEFLLIEQISTGSPIPDPRPLIPIPHGRLL
jgi:S-adenosylmethionine:tRNA ribosyltransferase-isomerase